MQADKAYVTKAAEMRKAAEALEVEEQMAAARKEAEEKQGHAHFALAKARDKAADALIGSDSDEEPGTADEPSPPQRRRSASSDMDRALARNAHALLAMDLVKSADAAVEKAKGEFVSAAAARITADAAVDHAIDIAAAKSAEAAAAVSKADAVTKEKARIAQRLEELKAEAEQARLDVEQARLAEVEATAPCTWVFSGGNWVRVLEGQAAPEADTEEPEDEKEVVRKVPEGALHTLAPRHLSAKFVESQEALLSTMYLRMRVRATLADFAPEERCERLTSNLGTLLHVPADVIGLRTSRGNESALEALTTAVVLEAEVHFEDARALGIATKMLAGANQTWVSTVLGEQLIEAPEVFNDTKMPARTLGKPTALQGSLEDLIGLPPMRLDRGILTDHTESIDSLVPFTSQVSLPSLADRRHCRLRARAMRGGPSGRRTRSPTHPHLRTTHPPSCHPTHGKAGEA